MSTESSISRTPEPPYYVVIFTSKRDSGDNGYEAMANRMVELASTMTGFIGSDSARGPDGVGITVSYWKDENSIRNWKKHAEHLEAQRKGKESWYEEYSVRVAKVGRAYRL